MGFPEEHGSSSGHEDPQRMLFSFFPIFLWFLGDDFEILLSSLFIFFCHTRLLSILEQNGAKDCNT